MFKRLRRSLQSLLHAVDVSPQSALMRHFLRQFFQSSGDSAETPVVRSLAAVGTPMLMAAFWIVALTSGLRPPLRPWPAATIHYLFVLYAFCAMGCVTTVQWERLFPERLDFLVLLPMPLRGRTIFAAKLRAVAVFLLLFLAAANVFGALLLPVLSGRRLLIAMLAHGLAVFGAGMASALAVLAVESLLIAITPDRWFRHVATTVQTLLIAMFLLVFLRYATVVEQLPMLLAGSLPMARWFPPLWFLSVYEVGMGSITATPFAHMLARQAWMALPVLSVLAVVLYPAAWARRGRMALEGATSARLRDGRVWAMVHPVVLQHAKDRAVFHFMRQTLARLSRYHVWLAAYAGVGLALTLTSAITVDVSSGLHVELKRSGVQAALPLLLFWTVAGLHGAFSLPADLGARWVFRMAALHTQRVVSTAKHFVLVACCLLISVELLALAICGWRGSDLLLQGVFGLLCAVLLTDLFFYLEAHVPFTRPTLTERRSLPMTLALYVFGVPVLMLLMVTLERWVGMHVWRVVGACAAAGGVHASMHWLRGLPSHPASDDAFLDEMTEEIQTLGLNT